MRCSRRISSIAVVFGEAVVLRAVTGASYCRSNVLRAELPHLSSTLPGRLCVVLGAARVGTGAMAGQPGTGHRPRSRGPVGLRLRRTPGRGDPGCEERRTPAAASPARGSHGPDGDRCRPHRRHHLGACQFGQPSSPWLRPGAPARQNARRPPRRPCPLDPRTATGEPSRRRPEGQGAGRATRGSGVSNQPTSIRNPASDRRRHHHRKLPSSGSRRPLSSRRTRCSRRHRCLGRPASSGWQEVTLGLRPRVADHA